MPEYSISPTGEKFALPTKEDYAGRVQAAPKACSRRP